MSVVWVWLVGFITEMLKKFQGLAQISAFLNIPKGCSGRVYSSRILQREVKGIVGNIK